MAAVTLTRAARDCLAQTPARGAEVVGFIRDSAGQRISGVRITVGADTTRFAVSDSTGAFRIRNVPPGLHRVSFRRLGFVPATFTVSLSPGDSLPVLVILAELAQPLEPIEVSGPFNPPLERSGFYERRRQRELGILAGTFIDPEEIASRRVPQTTYLLEGVAGVFIHREEYRGRRVAIPQGRTVGRGGLRCQMAVFLDGRELDPRDLLDDVVNPFDVAAIEVYPSASGTPARFQSTRLNNPCGSIVIWTKSGR